MQFDVSNTAESVPTEICIGNAEAAGEERRARERELAID